MNTETDKGEIFKTETDKVNGQTPRQTKAIRGHWDEQSQQVDTEIDKGDE